MPKGIGDGRNIFTISDEIVNPCLLPEGIPNQPRPGLTVGALCWLGAIRSPMDKRSCVVLALKECPKKTQREIAEQVGCSQQHVGMIQKELTSTCKLAVPTTRTGKDGKTYPTSYKKAAKVTMRKVRTFARMPHDVWKV